MLKKIIYISAVLILVSSCSAKTSNSHHQAGRKNNPDSWFTNYISPPVGVSPENTYTFMCEIITKRPETLTNTCADFGEQVDNIKWQKWSVYGSVGTGTYSVNNCNPNCAEEKLSRIPVFLSLDGVTTDGKRYFLNTLNIRSKNAVEKGGVYTYWDLGSFYREVPGMRG